MSAWKFNDHEFEVDLYDLDMAERIEQGLDGLAAKADKIDPHGKLSDTIRAYCQIHIDFFDEIIGVGTSGELFNGKTNVRLCDAAYESFIEFVNNEARQLSSARNALLAKYAPRKGRAKG